MPSLTACQQTASGSVSAASSNEISSGTSTKLRLGIATISANAPSLGCIDIICLFPQRFDLFVLHSLHFWQETNGLIVTLLPFNGPSITSPAASCPRIKGAGRRSSCPKYACMSEPQMPTDRMEIRFSPSFNCGSGTSRNSNDLMPVYTNAFIWL